MHFYIAFSKFTHKPIHRQCNVEAFHEGITLANFFLFEFFNFCQHLISDNYEVEGIVWVRVIGSLMKALKWSLISISVSLLIANSHFLGIINEGCVDIEKLIRHNYFI